MCAYNACGHHLVHLTVENKLEVRMIILFVVIVAVAVAVVVVIFVVGCFV